MMIRCLLIKRKLYDYFDNSLSEVEHSKIKEHLDTCSGCRNNLMKIKDVVDIARSKRVPHPTEEFWRKFQGELDDKLNEVLVPAYKPGFWGRSRVRSLVFVPAVSLLVLIMALSVQFHQKNSDKALLEELNVLEEVSSAVDFSNGLEFYIEETFLASEM
jgi:anti-sigma factor RsiW